MERSMGIFEKIFSENDFCDKSSFFKDASVPITQVRELKTPRHEVHELIERASQMLHQLEKMTNDSNKLTDRMSADMRRVTNGESSDRTSSVLNGNATDESGRREIDENLIGGNNLEEDERDSGKSSSKSDIECPSVDDSSPNLDESLPELEQNSLEMDSTCEDAPSGGDEASSTEASANVVKIILDPGMTPPDSHGETDADVAHSPTKKKRSALHRVMIKRNGSFLCSECAYETIHYTTFHSHCTRQHSDNSTEKNRDNSGNILYDCSQCVFATFSLKGFKTHCKAKHRKDTYENIINRLPLSNPKAETQFKLFVGSLTDSKQRKQALQLLKRNFTNNNDLLCGGELIRCMMCGYSSAYPNNVESHYMLEHGTCGPIRSKEDELFQCEKCDFRHVSYRALHRHYDTCHELLDEFARKTEEEERTLKCDCCEFTTTGKCEMLNHWRFDHHRVYPPFVADRIFEDFRRHLVEVNLPKRMANDKWTNGWMNPECTGLIKSELYSCSICKFRCAAINTMNSHYASHHPDDLCSLSTLEVVEGGPSNGEDRPLCKRNVWFRCTHCPSEHSCFYRNMLTHYKEAHKGEMGKLGKGDLSSLIHSATALRCAGCGEMHPNYLTLLRHLTEQHSGSIATFSTVSNGNTTLYVCKLCDCRLTTLQDTARHLEHHRARQLGEFERHHVAAYCCSKCRRVFRSERFVRQHYSRLHLEWTESSFAYKDFPENFFIKNLGKTNDASNHGDKSPEEAEKAEEPDPAEVDSASSAEKRRHCRVCKFSASNDVTMQTHHERAHATPKRDEDLFKKPSKPVSARRLQSTCSHPTLAGKSPAVYARHVLNHHNTEEPHKCAHCNKSYVCAVVLRMHVRKKHKLCNISPSKTVLIQRRLSSSCTHRNIKTRNPKLYRAHVTEKHSDKLPYHCPHCVISYVCAGIFALHLRKLHKQPTTNELLRDCKNAFDQSEVVYTPVTGPKVKVKAKAKVNHKVATTDLQRGTIGEDRTKHYTHATKHYTHPKSVKTATGNWKCLYCKQLFDSYTAVRRHVAKLHPSCQVLRCRWCDYVCKTNVQLSNHLKIHSEFVNSRMRTLRQIWKNKRLQRLNGDVCAIDEDMDEVIEAVSEATEGAKVKQTARKSMKPSSGGNKLQNTQTPNQTNLSEDDISPNLSMSFKQTHYGTIKCKLCDFVTTDHRRVLLHLKSNHVTERTFQCKLCFFTSPEFPRMRSHLVDHHKMERNHHLVVEMSVSFGADGDTVAPSNGRSGRPRRRGYEPQPSVPIVRPSYMRDIFDPSGKIRPATGEAPSDAQKAPPGKSHFTRSTSLERFECKYCDVEASSTYEMERHMMRHEAAAVDATRIDEAAFVLSGFTSFLESR